MTKVQKIVKSTGNTAIGPEFFAALQIMPSSADLCVVLEALAIASSARVRANKPQRKRTKTKKITQARLQNLVKSVPDAVKRMQDPFPGPLTYPTPSVDRYTLMSGGETLETLELGLMNTLAHRSEQFKEQALYLQQAVSLSATIASEAFGSGKIESTSSGVMALPSKRIVEAVQIDKVEDGFQRSSLYQPTMSDVYDPNEGDFCIIPGEKTYTVLPYRIAMAALRGVVQMEASESLLDEYHTTVVKICRILGIGAGLGQPAEVYSIDDPGGSFSFSAIPFQSPHSNVATMIIAVTRRSQASNDEDKLRSNLSQLVRQLPRAGSSKTLPIIVWSAMASVFSLPIENSIFGPNAFKPQVFNLMEFLMCSAGDFEGENIFLEYALEEDRSASLSSRSSTADAISLYVSNNKSLYFSDGEAPTMMFAEPNSSEATMVPFVDTSRPRFIMSELLGICWVTDFQSGRNTSRFVGIESPVYGEIFIRAGRAFWLQKETEASEFWNALTYWFSEVGGTIEEGDFSTDLPSECLYRVEEVAGDSGQVLVIEDRVMKIHVNSFWWMRGQNLAEREMARSIVIHLTGIDSEEYLNKIAPIGPKRMMHHFEAQRHAELDPGGIVSPPKIEHSSLEFVLDELGSKSFDGVYQNGEDYLCRTCDSYRYV